MINELEMLSFDGDDSCDDCGGWDGESERCECGVRRVSWECYMSNCKCDEVMQKQCEHAYPAAY